MEQGLFQAVLFPCDEKRSRPIQSRRKDLQTERTLTLRRELPPNIFRGKRGRTPFPSLKETK